MFYTCLSLSDIVPVGVIAGGSVGSSILLLLLLFALIFYLYRQRKGSCRGVTLKPDIKVETVNKETHSLEEEAASASTATRMDPTNGYYNVRATTHDEVRASTRSLLYQEFRPPNPASVSASAGGPVANIHPAPTVMSPGPLSEWLTTHTPILTPLPGRHKLKLSPRPQTILETVACWNQPIRWLLTATLIQRHLNTG
ncbi:kin of IRRE-like protein 1 isoform X2 [Megalobrama amblycephala]|uniref:kin of IRRE-like protein 1 isoform X2 n=1 Tax=Megalobrama amblycephala TaxID=75352 RepID=UPI00201464AA|nr:kin of IRRE-like protein 1 isoform X2 [Megalobrama amblycephala]